jgi:hypothetical protein
MEHLFTSVMALPRETDSHCPGNAHIHGDGERKWTKLQPVCRWRSERAFGAARQAGPSADHPLDFGDVTTPS